MSLSRGVCLLIMYIITDKVIFHRPTKEDKVAFTYQCTCVLGKIAISFFVFENNNNNKAKRGNDKQGEQNRKTCNALTRLPDNKVLLNQI